MRSFILIFLLKTCFTISIFAQTPEIDSLRAALESSKGRDRFEQLNQLAIALRHCSPEQSLTYANEALMLARELGEEKHTARAYTNIGNAYFLMNQYHKALEAYFKAESIYTHYNDTDNIANINNNIAAVYLKTGDVDKTIERFTTALEIKHKLGDSTNIANISSNLGVVYMQRKDYNAALTHFRKALEIHTKLKNKTGIADLSNNIAELYILRKQYPEAKEMLLAAESNYLANNNMIGVARARANLGLCCGFLGENTKAAMLFEDAVRLAREARALDVESDTYRAIRDYYASRGDYTNAYHYSLHYQAANDSIFNRTLVERLAEVETEYLQARREREMELLRKENEIQAQENKMHMIYLYFSIALFAVIIGLFGVVYNRYRVKRKINAKLNIANLRLKESEFKLQESNRVVNHILSVIAHDLRNPVNTVYGFSELLHDHVPNLAKDEVKKYSGIIYNTSLKILGLLENLLNWSKAESKALEYKPERIALFLLLEEVLSICDIHAAQKSISVVNEVPTQVHAFADHNLIESVLRNLINNAIKFTHEGGTVKIKAATHGDEVHMSVVDNGTGIAEDSLAHIFDANFHETTEGTAQESGTGLGLYLCKEFLSINKGRIWVESKPGRGSTFTFSLPAGK